MPNAQSAARAASSRSNRNGLDDMDLDQDSDFLGFASEAVCLGDRLVAQGSSSALRLNGTAGIEDPNDF